MSEEQNSAAQTRTVRPVDDHGDAFFGAAPNRAEGLGKGLRKRPPPPRPDQAPASPTPESSSQEPEGVGSDAEPDGEDRGPEKRSGRSSNGDRKGRPKQRQKPTQRSEPTDGRTTLSARLPAGLKARLNSRSKMTQHSHAQVLVAAFNHCHKQIPELFKDASDDDLHDGLEEGDLLFAPIPNRVRDTRGTGTTQVTFPLAVEYRTAIDNLVERYEQVPNRNSLIIRVLDAYLPSEDETGGGDADEPFFGAS